MSFYERHGKRAFDIAGGAVLGVAGAPFMAAAAALLWRTQGRPILFHQDRVGRDGREFTIVKFRTMVPGAAGHGAGMWFEPDDPRVTPVGRWLRASSIDELPQVWNVLLGEMSWIGPRPEAIALSEWYMAELPFYTYRHIVRPGITGWAQVNQGHVADLDSVYAKLHYDFYYIKNFSGWLDILILARTVATVFSGNGAK